MVIALTGFMGSGKSSVGRELSSLLNLPFADLDERIEAKAGRSIPEIFETEGESSFRALETLVLGELLEKHSDGDLILSLGGGTIISDENASKVARSCKCIYLRASAAAIRKRLGGESGGRPMLRNGNLEQLLASRIPVYEKCADIIIDTDTLTPVQLAREIAEILEH